MHFLEATFRTALKNKGFKEPNDNYGDFGTYKHLQVCRNGYNLAKDLHNSGVTAITRFKDHERFFVRIEYVEAPVV